MYTPHGQTQRSNLLKISNFGEVLMPLLRPIMDKIPATVVSRTLSSGSGAKKKYSTPYSKSWARKRQAAGRQLGLKDFFYSGEMWGTYKVTNEESTGTKITYTLSSDGGMASNGSHLVDVHSDKESQNILDITDDEWKKVEDEMFAMVEKAFSRYL